MAAQLPTYEILKVLPDSSVRMIAEAEGIEAARLAVVTLLFEREAAELEIVLDGRMVEVGTLECRGPHGPDFVTWRTVGRGRDLR